MYFYKYFVLQPKGRKRVSIKSDTEPSHHSSHLEYISLYQRAVEEEMHELAALIANTVETADSASQLVNCL